MLVREGVSMSPKLAASRKVGTGQDKTVPNEPPKRKSILFDYSFSIPTRSNETLSNRADRQVLQFRATRTRSLTLQLLGKSGETVSWMCKSCQETFHRTGTKCAGRTNFLEVVYSAVIAQRCFHLLSTRLCC